jgi:hypothetical protein
LGEEINESSVRFEVLMASSMKMRAFCDIASCGLAGVADVSDGRTASIIRAMKNAVCTTETSLFSRETARRYITEDTNLQMKAALA